MNSSFEILNAKDFTFEPFTPPKGGDSGSLLLATLKTNPREQYVIKGNYQEAVCNEFMYHHVAAALGLQTQETRLFKGVKKQKRSVGIRYIPNARLFDHSTASEENKEIFYKFQMATSENPIGVSCRTYFPFCGISKSLMNLWVHAVFAIPHNEKSARQFTPSGFSEVAKFYLPYSMNQIRMSIIAINKGRFSNWIIPNHSIWEDWWLMVQLKLGAKSHQNIFGKCFCMVCILLMIIGTS